MRGVVRAATVVVNARVVQMAITEVAKMAAALGAGVTEDGVIITAKEDPTGEEACFLNLKITRSVLVDACVELCRTVQQTVRLPLTKKLATLIANAEEAEVMEATEVGEGAVPHGVAGVTTRVHPQGMVTMVRQRHLAPLMATLVHQMALVYVHLVNQGRTVVQVVRDHLKP